MPRRARKDIISKYLHIVSKGINSEKIFKENKYKQEYINLCKKYFSNVNNSELLIYCVMDNHVHMLIYSEDIMEVSTIMRKINTSYGIYYNSQENREGYVFKDRFYIQEIEEEGHLLRAIVYIHQNPIKALIVDRLEEYKYSSYNEYNKCKVNEKNARLLFGTASYKEIFDFIHNCFYEFSIGDEVENDFEQEEILNYINQFTQKYEIKLEDIRKNDFLILNITKELKEKFKIKDKQISKLLNIGKNRLNNIRKKQ